MTRKAALTTGAGRILEGERASSATASRPAVDSTMPASVHGARYFFAHLGEMLLAMVVGMMVLGMLDRGTLAAAGASVSNLRETAPEAVALVMAFNMTVGMTVWMRHRGHSWARVGEMAGAMFVPAIGAIVLFWCAVVHRDAILPLEHVAMLPAMVAVMLLHRGEYSRPVHSHARKVEGADEGVLR